VVKGDKCMGVSQLLGARDRAAPPKSTPMGMPFMLRYRLSVDLWLNSFGFAAAECCLMFRAVLFGREPKTSSLSTYIALLIGHPFQLCRSYDYVALSSP